MKKLLFKIQEATWWFVAELEDVLYPYRDREITHPLWAENSNSINVDEASFLKSQNEVAHQKIERLQSEMIYVLEKLRKLESINITSDKNDQTILHEGQEGSETNHQEGKETS